MLTASIIPSSEKASIFNLLAIVSIACPCNELTKQESLLSRLEKYPSFAVGVQWHAEYEPEKNELNKCLFAEFGSACSLYSNKK